jgi:hypothetical protein
VTGACVLSGCTSNRECVFLFNDGRASCDRGECVLACSSDYECDSARNEVCGDGRCIFAGCDNDAECRAALGVENQEPGVEVVCRAP